MTSADQQYWEERARKHGAAACGCLNPVEYRYEERLRWDAFRRLVKVRPGWNVLDIGCGTGTWSRRIAAMGARVVGADFSAEMIKMAEPAPDCEFMVGSAQDLALPDAQFDLAVSVTVLQHITSDAELDCAFTNIRRMLKPGGQFFLLEYSPNHQTVQPAGAGHMRYRTTAEWTERARRAHFGLVRITGVRFIGHRVLGAAIVRWRRWRGRGHSPEIDSGDLDRAERALERASSGLDLISARIPGSRRASDVHGFLFVRTT